MSGQHDPNNRFETWADGMTPSAQQPPSSSWTPLSAGPEETTQSFPTYPYSAPTASYPDPPQDEAYAAFRDYQGNTQRFPGQSVQPYQAYQAPYGRAWGPMPRAKASYALPSLILGIISTFCGGITGPISIGLGIAALRQLGANPALGGRGQAIAGIALGTFGSFFMLMMILGIFLV